MPLFSCSPERSPVSRKALLLGSSLLLSATPLQAQDVEISEDRDTAIDTSSFLGLSPALLTLIENVTISAPTGPVITVNGPHSLSLAGTVQSLDSTTGIGIFVDTSTDILSDIQIDGDIVLNGPDGFDLDLTLESTNTGILFDGPGSFTGDLTLSDSGSISVWGAGSTGIAINSAFIGDIEIAGSTVVQGNRAIGIAVNAPLTGDLTISGPVVSTNPDGAAVAINAPIQGGFILEGSLQAGETQSFDDDGNIVDAIPGIAALHVTDSVTNGLLFQGFGVEFTEDGDGDDTTTLVNSAINTSGGTPALRIENTATANDLTIGAVDGSSYGVLIRGNFDINGTSAGLPATGIVLSGQSPDALTLIEGGIHFDTGVLDVTTTDADSTGIVIGDYASVPEIYNRGTITAQVLISTEINDAGETEFGPGGSAIGVRVEENGSLQSFTNTANVLVGGNGNTSSATGLLDLSGTLTSIRNEENAIWRAIVARPTDDPISGSAIAIDVRANTSGVNLYNAGEIVGDIYLGDGDDTVEFQNGTLSGTLDFGAGANSFSLSETSQFSGSINHNGTLDLFVSGADLELGLNESLNVTTASFADASTISLLLDPKLDTQGSLNATSSVFIANDTRIDPDISSFVFSETTFTFLNAGTLTVDTQNLDDLLTETPFLYNTSLGYADDNPDSLELIVTPKTAVELDLDPNASALYEHFLSTELSPSEQIENAIANLPSRESANNAFTSLLGDTSSASIDLALIFGDLQRTHQQDRLADFIRTKNPETSIWARQYATYTNGTSSSAESWATNSISVGVGVGADLAASDNFMWGVSAGFLLSGVSRELEVGDELSVFTPHIGAYAMARAGNFYTGLSANAVYHDIDRERTIAIGNVTQITESTTSAYQLQGTFSAGYNLQAGKFSLNPSIGIDTAYYSESGYTEDEASSVSLTVGSRSLTRVDAVARVSAGYDFIWKKGANPTIIRPEIFAEYSSALVGDNAGFVDVGFSAAADTVRFAIDEIGKNVKTGGVAFRFLGSGADATVRYTYREKDFITSHEASLYFHLPF